jgi:hypothetical protein
MEQMENQQEIINAAVAHVITWMAMRMMTTALSLAFDAGLFDLKSTYHLCIWRYIKMLSAGSIDFNEDLEDFLREYHEFLDEDVTSLNRNAALLYNLQRSLEIGMIGRIV